MVQFRVCGGHISFQALKEKHQLRKNEERPVISYFPSVGHLIPRKTMSPLSSAWRKQAITQQSQAHTHTKENKMKIVPHG